MCIRRLEKRFVAWHRFSKQLLHGNEPLRVNDLSIYLYHENEVHYDVVLDVEGVEIEKCEAENKIQSFSCGFSKLVIV